MRTNVNQRNIYFAWYISVVIIYVCIQVLTDIINIAQSFISLAGVQQITNNVEINNYFHPRWPEDGLLY